MNCCRESHHHPRLQMQENLNMTPKPKILLVDDKLDNLFVLEKNLACLEVESICALSGKQAIGEVLKHDFALLIIDVQMPEMDGYQTVEQLRQNPEHRQLPVIFVFRCLFRRLL
jgi:two-component system sensor histidine kinase/response regulator